MDFRDSAPVFLSGEVLRVRRYTELLLAKSEKAPSWSQLPKNYSEVNFSKQFRALDVLQRKLVRSLWNFSEICKEMRKWCHKMI